MLLGETTLLFLPRGERVIAPSAQPRAPVDSFFGQLLKYCITRKLWSRL